MSTIPPQYSNGPPASSCPPSPGSFFFTTISEHADGERRGASHGDLRVSQQPRPIDNSPAQPPVFAAGMHREKKKDPCSGVVVSIVRRAALAVVGTYIVMALYSHGPTTSI